MKMTEIIMLALLLLFYACANKEKNTEIPSILDFYEIEEIDQAEDYILDLHCNKKHLIVYGTHHTFNPTDSIFYDIKEKFDKLKPTLALNEGGNWEIFSTKDSSIQESGEAGFLIFLSKGNGNACFSFEPPKKEEIKFILSKYPTKEVLLMYLCRQTVQIQRQYESNKDTLKFYESINELFRSLKAQGIPISNTEEMLSKLKSLYKEMFNEEFNWRTFDPSNIYPNEYKTKLNEINREISNFRDKAIVDLIKNELDKYDKIFVLIGTTHVYKQEPLLRYYFEEICNSN